MDFALVGTILVLLFVFGAISPRFEAKASRKREVAARPEPPAEVVPTSPESSAPSHPTTRAA